MVADSPELVAVPRAVSEAGLGYEFLRAKWMSEDDQQSTMKKRVARAMMDEIVRAAERRKNDEASI